MNYQIAIRTKKMGVFGAAVLILMLSALTTLAQSDQSPASSQTTREQQKAVLPENLYFTIEHTSNLSVFARAIKTAGLTDTLKGSGPFTVFAPTDEAFAALPAGTVEELFKPENKERLVNLLIEHILPEKATESELTVLNDKSTLKRTPLKLRLNERNQITLGKDAAVIAQANKITENGVLHIIDRVLIPE